MATPAGPRSGWSPAAGHSIGPPATTWPTPWYSRSTWASGRPAPGGEPLPGPRRADSVDVASASPGRPGVPAPGGSMAPVHAAQWLGVAPDHPFGLPTLPYGSFTTRDRPT